MFKHFKNYKTYIYLIILILLSATIYHVWLSFNIFTNGDWNFAYAQTIKENTNLLSWSFMVNLGGINYLLWELPLYYLYGIIGILGYGTNVSDKILVFWPTLLLANIASYLLVKKITKSNLSGFIGAIVFNYNTYYFVANTAFLLYSAAAWSVLTLYLFINALERRKLALFLLSALTLFVTGSYDFRIAYITVFLLGLYFFFFCFFIEEFKFKEFVKNLSFFVLQGIIFTLLNSYWLLSFYASKSVTSNTILNRGLFGNEFLNILYSISFFHPFWAGNSVIAFIPQPIFAYFWLIPIFAFLGLYFNRKNKNILFFGLIALLGIFLTKQVGHPFPNIYPFLFKYLPGFNAFREASKFYYLIALGYSVLIGGFIYWTIKFGGGNKLRNTAKYFLIFLIAIIFIFNAKSIFTEDLGGIYKPLTPSKDYSIFNNFILSQGNNYFRTLWVPRFSRWGMVTASHPEVSAIDEIYADWNKYINKEQNQDILFQAELITKLLNKKYAKNLFDESSIRYVIIPVEDIKNGDDFFNYYGKPRQYYINELNKIPWLHRMNIDTKDLIVYENYGYKPHIYITKELETINKNQAYEKQKYLFKNSSEYKVTIKKVKAPFYLNFSEEFNTGWKIYLGDFKWYGILLNRQEAITGENHFQNDATLNSFYIDPNNVCKVESCKINKDGTYDIDITIYFAPQSYMYFGLIISGLTLTLVVGYLMFELGKYAYDKRKN